MRIQKGVDIPDIDLSPVNAQVATLGEKMDAIMEQIKTPAAPPATNILRLNSLIFLKDEET